MIVKNRLLNFKDKVIYQDDDYFSFSLDSLLLANFVTINYRFKNIIDLCSGNAVIPMLLTYRTKANIVGVEVQNEIVNLANMSILENGLGNKIKIDKLNVKDVGLVYDCGFFDVVTCNPPYFKYKSDSLINDNIVKTIARHEILINFDDIVKSCSYLVKNGGYVAFVHRPDRFVEIIDTMRKYGITPKRVRFVYPKKGRDANILLVEGIKNGNEGLKILAPLFVYDDDGNYDSEIIKMFGDG